MDRFKKYLIASLFLGALALTSVARAQDAAPLEDTQEAYIADIYNAPGNYGTAYGSASFGKPRTWSAYSSSYGGGYGTGYGPSAILPGRHGVGIWSEGAASGGAGVPATGFYWTFRVPYSTALPTPSGPPMGFYAPAYGPPSSLPW